MKTLAIRESPIPVLLLLVSLYGFVEYLHHAVVRRESRIRVIRVPASPPDATPGNAPYGLQPLDAAAAWTAGAGIPAGPVPDSGAGSSAGTATGPGVDPGRAPHSRTPLPDLAGRIERGVRLLRLDRPNEALEELEAARGAGNSSAMLSYHLALARARTGDFSGAEAEYRAALERNPRFDEAWNNLGLLQEAHGDRVGALESLRRAADLAPVSTRARPLVNLARLLRRENRSQEARELLEQAIRLSPSDPTPRLVLASLESESPGRANLAREVYRQVIRLAPAEPEAYFGLALLESRTGNQSAAEREYLASLEVDPGHRKSRHNLGRLYLDTGRPAEAARHFESLIQAAPDPKALFGLARARRMLHDTGGSEAAYREAIRQAGGRYPEASLNLGHLLHDAGRDEDAEAAYREALAHDPAYSAAWINLAILLASQDRPGEAREAVDRALATDPKNAKAWFLRGRLLSADRPEEALTAYLEAVRIQPDYLKAMLNAAVLHAEGGRDAEAIRLYRDVLVRDPRNALAWFNLGLALGRTGREDEAREAYEAALRADPEATRAAQNLGVLYARVGRIEDARRVFAEALERRPEDPGLRYNLALQLAKLGRTPTAIRELERVVHLDPGHIRAWTVLARLLEKEGRSDEAARARSRSLPIQGNGRSP